MRTTWPRGWRRARSTATKRQIYLDQHRDVGTAVAESDRMLESMIPSPDYLEGVRALTERRLPDWPAR